MLVKVPFAILVSTEIVPAAALRLVLGLTYPIQNERKKGTCYEYR